MADPFYYEPRRVGDPAQDALTIIPSDATVLDITQAVYVGVTGNLNVVMMSGATVTFTAVPAGVYLPIRVSKVLSTGTTATNIVALY